MKKVVTVVFLAVILVLVTMLGACATVRTSDDVELSGTPQDSNAENDTAFVQGQKSGNYTLTNGTAGGGGTGGAGGAGGTGGAGGKKMFGGNASPGGVGDVGAPGVAGGVV